MKSETDPRTNERAESMGRRNAEYFDKYGGVWRTAYNEETERWYEYHPWRLRERYALNLLRGEHKGLAVDLGCGNGHALVQMAKMGFQKAVGVDVSDKMLSSAQDLIKANNLAGSIELIKSDVQDVKEIAAGSADACMALGVIEYLGEDGPFLSEVRRILIPGGAAVIETHNYHCVNSRTIEALQRIIPSLRAWIKINCRHHRPAEFRKTASVYGFSVEAELFSHFHGAYPLNLVPLLCEVISPVDRILSRACECWTPSSLRPFLASMYIVKLRKPI